MCQKIYQDKCYSECKLWDKCVSHKLISCDKCGRRIKPKDLIVIDEKYYACSTECVYEIVRKLRSNPNLIPVEVI